jgi:GWxTD domain-containing protein
VGGTRPYTAPSRSRFARAVLVLVAASTVFAANPVWLDRVDPIITAAEKKTYIALKPEARHEFEENFFAGKAITSGEYFQRVAHIDAAFGSGKPGSGANTDQGRIYLALGAPNKITRLPSSRIFVPIEIWYYDVVPGVLNTELRLMFFQKNNVGYPRLYSPQTDTIRALLLPEAATVHLFGPNDSTNESDLRGVLNTGPVEDEVITASVNVATGIKYSGNEEILGRVSSPMAMLSHPPRTEVTSKLITARPKLDVVQTVSAFGGSQVDLRLETAAQSEIDIEVIGDKSTVYQNQVHLKFSKAEPVLYTHRLDLLPGSWRVLFTVDGKTYPYVVDVSAQVRAEILRVNSGGDVAGRETPFEFNGKQIEVNPAGRFAMVALAQPGKVTWMLHHGAETVWKATSEGRQIATVELPSSGIRPGLYKLEATTADTSASVDFAIGEAEGAAPKAAAISFNANLAPARRLAFVGHQWLVRGKLAEARRALEASLAKGSTEEARVELARVDALAGDLDAARDRVRGVLAAKPDNFEALSVFAYIETRLQDYAVAAQLYRRALAVQDSPAIRAALASLPGE